MARLLGRFGQLARRLNPSGATKVALGRSGRATKSVVVKLHPRRLARAVREFRRIGSADLARLARGVGRGAKGLVVLATAPELLIAAGLRSLRSGCSRCYSKCSFRYCRNRKGVGSPAPPRRPRPPHPTGGGETQNAPRSGLQGLQDGENGPESAPQGPVRAVRGLQDAPNTAAGRVRGTSGKLRAVGAPLTADRELRRGRGRGKSQRSQPPPRSRLGPRSGIR